MVEWNERQGELERVKDGREKEKGERERERGRGGRGRGRRRKRKRERGGKKIFGLMFKPHYLHSVKSMLIIGLAQSLSCGIDTIWTAE